MSNQSNSPIVEDVAVYTTRSVETIKRLVRERDEAREAHTAAQDNCNQQAYRIAALQCELEALQRRDPISETVGLVAEPDPEAADITPNTVAHRVIGIGLEANDPERAHVLEDNLLWDLVRAIAYSTCTNPKGSCKEMMKSRKLNFNRYCA